VGLGHRRQRTRALILKRFGSVSCSTATSIRSCTKWRARTVPHRHVDRLPATGARRGSFTGPMKVEPTA
jgi:hypothetical protein